jgi:hypothetical protein
VRNSAWICLATWLFAGALGTNARGEELSLAESRVFAAAFPARTQPPAAQPTAAGQPPTAADDAFGVCDSCGGCAGGCRACRGCAWGGLEAGVEATFLQLNEVDHRWLFLDDLGAPVVDGSLLGFQGYEAAPRIWLGCDIWRGWGLRSRYWHFDAEADNHNVSLDQNLDVTTINSYAQFESYTIDLEATKDFHGDIWDVELSFGARHASFDRVASFDAMAQRNDVFASIWNGTRHDDTGLTAALETSVQLNYGIALVANFRGSFLWGNANVDHVSVLTDGVATGVNAIAIDDPTASMNILELQAGIEWSHYLQSLRADVFFRAMFEYQNWDGKELDFEFLQFVNGSVVAGASLETEAEFAGVAFSAGARW